MSNLTPSARHRGARTLPATAMLVVLGLALAAPSATLAADGGPSLNIPVPASARVGAAAAPATTTARAGTVTTIAPAAATTTPAPTVTTLAPLATTPTRLAAPRAAHRSSGTSNTAIALAALAAVLVLCCAAWAIARSRGVEPHWTLALRHSMAEASHRASATWAELGDWVRLGR